MSANVPRSKENDYTRAITLNATAIFVLTQAVGQRCKAPRRRGKVINIASIQGLIGACPEGMLSLAYNASKAAVVT